MQQHLALPRSIRASKHNMSKANMKAIAQLKRYIMTSEIGMAFADTAMMELLPFTHHYYPMV
jgi:hypothetical protein